MVNTKPKLDIKPINDQAPTQLKGPTLSDKIEISKNDACFIINALMALTGYQALFTKTGNKETIEMTRLLADKVDPK